MASKVLIKGSVLIAVFANLAVWICGQRVDKVVRSHMDPEGTPTGSTAQVTKASRAKSMIRKSEFSFPSLEWT